ncbi:DUF4041 domain-containing protein [Anaerobutyricum hallii]|nr:DUF4041 domain-containing protein [Anaerobutyricum hallii]
MNLNSIRKKQEIEAKSKELDKISKDIITFSDEVLVQEYGLYQPRYNFMSSDVYKERLTTIRNQQKQMIKQDIAASGNTDWTVNNNKAKGRKMVNDMKKLLLRAFNSECDETIGKVKYNNIETSVRKIVKSAEQIQKLGTIMSVYINQSYIDLKIVELYLAFEYQQKKQQEKEEQRELRAQQREEAKLKKEIEEKRKKIKKEQTHYQQALKNLLSQIKEHGETEDLIAKKAELETELSNIDKSIKDIDYREANQKAGYVYVISNVGSFGENIYKIGMTRRLEPQDRVDKLGDASVPFKFDVHAMIFSDNAPALEAALHRAFEDRKLNMVNTRREFFYVTLDEIKQVVKENFDKTVEFIDFPDAEQYRTSLKMREQLLA